MPEEWNRAEGIYVPKEEKSTVIGQFQQISLLNVEGTIFYSIVAKRITKFLLKNEYIDTAIQKAGVPGFSGCLEYNSVITELTRCTQREQNARFNVTSLTSVIKYNTHPPWWHFPKFWRLLGIQCINWIFPKL